ncbi:site-specific integrase [Thermaerobacter litoralis]
MDPLASWLHGRPATTRRVYAAALADLQASVSAAWHAISIADLQAWSERLAARSLVPATQARYLATARSFFRWLATRGASAHQPGGDPPASPDATAPFRPHLPASPSKPFSA